jgi:hypothetical protein
MIGEVLSAAAGAAAHARRADGRWPEHRARVRTHSARFCVSTNTGPKADAGSTSRPLSCLMASTASSPSRAARGRRAARQAGPGAPRRRIDCFVADLAIRAGVVSSPGFGVAEARALDVLPLQCIVDPIEAANFTSGAEPSPEATDAMGEVAILLLAEL